MRIRRPAGTAGLAAFALLLLWTPAPASGIPESPRKHRLQVHPFMSWLVGGINAEYGYHPAGSLFEFAIPFSLGRSANTGFERSSTSIYGLGLGAMRYISRAGQGGHIGLQFEFLQGRTRFAPGSDFGDPGRVARLNEEIYAVTAAWGYRFIIVSPWIADFGAGATWIKVGDEKRTDSDIHGYQGFFPTTSASMGFAF